MKCISEMMAQTNEGGKKLQLRTSGKQTNTTNFIKYSKCEKKSKQNSEKKKHLVNHAEIQLNICLIENRCNSPNELHC